MNDGNLDIKLIKGEQTPIVTINFSDIIGQEAVKQKLMFYIMSHSSATPVPTFIFSGSHGLGKTYAASILASNMGRRFIEINCEMIQTVDGLIEGVLFERVAGNQPATILFDEAHRLTKEVSTVLLSLLSPSSKNKNSFFYKNAVIEYDMAKINVILATTDAFRIFKPLLNRCERVYFGHYSNEELFRILQYYLPKINIASCSVEDLAYACRGRARDAFLLADKIKRYCSINKKDFLTSEDWEKIKVMFEIFPRGLNRQEIELLTILRENGPISCANIATMMMVEESNISEEIEIRPKELGLIRNTSQGRVLSKDGEKYFVLLQ